MKLRDIFTAESIAVNYTEAASNRILISAQVSSLPQKSRDLI